MSPPKYVDPLLNRKWQGSTEFRRAIVEDSEKIFVMLDGEG